MLNRLGCSRQAYQDNPQPEEDFCWLFSRKMCRELGLPYSNGREMVSRVSTALTDRLIERRNEVTEKLFWYFCVLEGILFGSPYDRRTELRWDDEGRPYLLAKE